MYIEPRGLRWLADYRALEPVCMLPGRCHVNLPDVRGVLAAILGYPAAVEIGFDTRLIHRRIRGRVLNLAFRDGRQLVLAVEWFTQNRAHFQHVCVSENGPLFHHTSFCRDGDLYPQEVLQRTATDCVPIVRVDFTIITQSHDEDAGTWIKRDRILALMFIEDEEVADMD